MRQASTKKSFISCLEKYKHWTEELLKYKLQSDSGEVCKRNFVNICISTTANLDLMLTLFKEDDLLLSSPIIRVFFEHYFLMFVLFYEDDCAGKYHKLYHATQEKNEQQNFYEECIRQDKLLNKVVTIQKEFYRKTNDKYDDSKLRESLKEIHSNLSSFVHPSFLSGIIIGSRGAEIIENSDLKLSSADKKILEHFRVSFEKNELELKKTRGNLYGYERSLMQEILSIIGLVSYFFMYKMHEYEYHELDLFFGRIENENIKICKELQSMQKKSRHEKLGSY